MLRGCTKYEREEDGDREGEGNVIDDNGGGNGICDTCSFLTVSGNCRLCRYFFILFSSVRALLSK